MTGDVILHRTNLRTITASQICADQRVTAAKFYAYHAVDVAVTPVHQGSIETWNSRGLPDITLTASSSDFNDKT